MTHPEAVPPSYRRPHCQFCGRFFRADPSVGDRQKSCGRMECHKKRKQTAQQRWTEKNPGYFKGRSDVVREAVRGKSPRLKFIMSALNLGTPEPANPVSPQNQELLALDYQPRSLEDYDVDDDEKR